MADLVMLIALCVAMLGGSFLAGILPLSVELSERKLRFVSALGAGLLVGAALAVIIPEGIHAVDAGAHCDEHRSVGAAEPTPVVVADKIVDAKNEKGIDVSKPDTVEAPVLGDGTHSDSLHACEKRDTHSVIGLSLVLGFVLMLVIDYYSTRKSSASSQTHITATLGLLVHAAADGIALGASALTSEVDLELIVFVAIMLHKAPAAFGLVSFLLHSSVDRQSIRRHLLAFSLAAPVTALITFAILQFWNQNYGTSSSLSPLSTGSVLLFSGGTFLYVATVHVLPEITHQADHHHHDLVQSSTEDRNSDVGYNLLPSSSPTRAIRKSSPVHAADDAEIGEFDSSNTLIIRPSAGGSGSVSHPGNKAQLEALDLVALIIGCLCPLLFAIGHSH